MGRQDSEINSPSEAELSIMRLVERMTKDDVGSNQVDVCLVSYEWERRFVSGRVSSLSWTNILAWRLYSNYFAVIPHVTLDIKARPH